MGLVYLVPAIYDAALGVFSFALPLFLVDRGVSPITIGSLLALPAMTQILLRIPAGMAAGRIGNVRAMLFGCALTAVSACIIAASPHDQMVAFVAIAQVMSGLGRASFWPANQAHLFDVARERIASVIGLYNFLVTLGGMAGPLMAGILITQAGSASAFWLLAAFSIASGSLLAWGEGRQARRQAATAARLAEEYPELVAASVDTTKSGGLDTGAALGGGAGDEVSRPGTSGRLAGPGVGPDSPMRSLGRVVRTPAVWLGGLICISSVIPFTVTTSFYQVFLRGLGTSAASISLLVTVRLASVAMFSLVTSSYVQPRTRAGLLMLSGVLGGLGLGLIPPLAGTAAAVLPMLLLGFCGGAMHNVQMAVAGEAVAPADRALAMALVGSVGNVAMMLTPLWHGWMTERGMLREAFGLTGVVLLLVATASWQWSRMQVGARRAPGIRGRTESVAR
jgi:MFS family permease